MTRFRSAVVAASIFVSGGIAHAQQVGVNGVTPPTSVTVAAGSVATLAISDGPGNTTDWVGLYAVGAADSSYLDWRYLSGSTVPPATGLTSATFTFPVPVVAGDYEFRFFADDGFGLITTSSVVTVTAATTQLTINGTAPSAGVTVAVGDTVSVGVTNGPGNATDWVALAATGSPTSAYVDWRYLNGATTAPSSGLTSATIAFAAPGAPGTYEFRFFVNDGFQQLATSGPLSVIVSAAQLAVNGVSPPATVTADAGSMAAVVVSNDPGNVGDWIGMYAAGASDTQWLGWQYLNGSTSPPATGTNAATVNFLLPASPGSYEFRLFSNNSYTKLATSASVVIAASTAQLVVNGVAPPNTASVAAGTFATVSISSAPGNIADWVALAVAGSPDTSFVDWRYLNGTTVPPASGLSAATVSFLAPATAGTYEFRLFAANTYERVATSSSVVVVAPTAQIAINGVAPPTAVNVTPGAALSVQVSGGPGNTTDWVALATSGTPSNDFVAWQYLSGTLTPPQSALTGATLVFTAPSTAGTYEVRFFAANTFTLLTTSGAVNDAQPASVQVTLISPQSGTTYVTTTPIVVAASVVASGTTISRVDFFADQALIGSVTSEPYHILWNASAGQPTLTAVAVDANNVQTTSAPMGITVTAPQATPRVTIAITSPFSSTSLNGPSSILLAADVSVANGTIARVDFLANGNVVGSAGASPYQVTWTSPASGAYLLTAVATDNTGQTTTSLPISVIVNTSGSGAGTLAPPVASPASGEVAPSQPIVLTAAAGATIYYTLDGSTPTGTSLSYAGPITVTGPTTIKALAAEAGWTSSAITTATYTIDATPPTLVAEVSPAPSPSGWNQTPVTVSFTCTDAASGVASCPGPVGFDLEGPNQTITVSASDFAGNTATTTVTVNIDRTPPQIANVSPATGTQISDDTVTVTAQVSDAVSGISTVACNDTSATMTGQTATCVVPLRNGQNTIIVHAVDLASNAASSSVRVIRTSAPTSVVLAPAKLQILVGQTRTLTPIGDAGLPLQGASWSINDPTIATIADDGSVTAVAPGDTTATASVDGLSTTAAISVRTVALTGDVNWVSPPPAGVYVSSLVPANRIDDDGPDMFSLDYDSNTGGYVASALLADGTRLWSEALSSSSYSLQPDGYGGALTVDYDGSAPPALIRLAGGSSAPAWRFDAPAGGSDGLSFFGSQPAVGPDGTVFLTTSRETHPDASGRGDDWEATLVAIDGATGLMKAQVLSPTSVTEVLSQSCGYGGRSQSGSFEGSVAVDDQGTAYVGTNVYLQSRQQVCGYVQEPDDSGGFDTVFKVIDGAGTFSISSDVSVLAVDSGGTSFSYPLWQWSQTAADTPDVVRQGFPDQEYAYTSGIMPDGSGGVLVSWIHGNNDGPLDAHIGRIANGAMSDHIIDVPVDVLTSFGVPPIQQVTSDGLILLQIYDENFNPHSVAYDLNTWAQKWTHDGTPVVALDSGGVVYADDDGTLTQVDDQGQVVNQSTLNGSYDLVSVLHGEGRMNAVDPYTSGVEEVQTGVYRESEESVVTLPSGLVLPFSCVNPPAIPTSKSFFHKSLVAPSDTSQPYSYRFLGDWSALGPQQAAVENAFTEWSDVLEFFAFQYGSPTQGATNIRFRKAADGEGADIGVRRTGDLPKGIAGQFNASGVQPDYHILGGTLFITTDARSVSGPDGYYKVGLHEIGHALGLWHTKRFHGTSVMNDLAGQDDVGGNIPDYVTKCDARKAIEYSLR